jgi:hypothetical protein
MSDRAYETATRYTWEDATTLMEEELGAAASGGRHAERAGAPVGAAGAAS